MTFRKESELLHCGCCWILKYFKRTCVRKPNYSFGRAIKDLNRENRALYGKLIETRKERRRHILNKPCSLSSDIQISNHNVIPNSDNFITSHESSTDLWPRAEVRVIKSSDTHLSKGSKQAAILGNNVNDGDKIHSEIFSKNVSSSGDVYEPKGAAYVFNDNCLYPGKDSNALPLVVLKNMDKYPMMNQGKDVVATYSLKDFDNSCISNKQISRIYPSVTKVLNATMSEHSKMLLKKWREKMIAELGQDGFMTFYKAQLNSGCQFHTAIQSFLRGTRAEDLLLDGQGVEGCWKSLTPIILKMKDVQILEGPVCHSNLLYHGVLDCVAQYQGKHILIEWKKSDKPKPTIQRTYDAPIQLSAYIGALNFDKNYPVQIEGGMVVVAYSDGSAAETFHLDLPQCYSYWRHWLQRLKSFWWQYYESQSTQSSSQKSQGM